MKKIILILLFTIISNIDVQSMTVKEGDKFEIKLNGNPSTGYSWYLENVSELNDGSITALNLSKNGRGKFVSKEGIGRIGAGGVFHFSFLANKVTNSPLVLKFAYKRPWKKKSLVNTVYNINVISK